LFVIHLCVVVTHMHHYQEHCFFILYCFAFAFTNIRVLHVISLQFTIPIPCQGQYCRPLVGLSTMLSPLWIVFYLHHQFDINLLQAQVATPFMGMGSNDSDNNSNHFEDDYNIVLNEDVAGSAAVMEISSKGSFYQPKSHSITPVDEAFMHHVMTILVLCIPVVVGLMVLMLAPPSLYVNPSTSTLEDRRGTLASRKLEPVQLPSLMMVPLGLYGFAIAATWIDAVADQLVDVLSFLGIVCHIPGPIMGLTVLAVGNSFGDLAANVTMARKGLSNMAITACFAGPVFNMLVGVALGFTLLGHSLNASHASSHSSGDSANSYSSSAILVQVHLTNPLNAAFLFSILNCIVLLVSGTVMGRRGTIGKGYGYAALVLYVMYTCISLAVWK
jgi:Ca2+/Na+ antiporter